MRNFHRSPPPFSASGGCALPSRRRRLFSAPRIFQFFVILVVSSLLTSLWLLVRLEAVYDTHVAVQIMNFRWEEGQQFRRQPERITSSNEVRMYRGERQLLQPMAQHPLEAKPSSNFVDHGASPQSASNRKGIRNKQLSKKPGSTTLPDLKGTTILPPSQLFPSLPSSLDYLGVMIDGGRHYFPLQWLYKQLQHINDLGYNYIHFRLTDDQNFILDLAIPNNGNSTSSSNRVDGTSLAFVARHEQELEHLLNSTHRVKSRKKSASGEEGKGQRLHYQAEELLEFVRYAKTTYNITVVPEVNIPGHAGSWGANVAFPDLVVACPQFACSEGYGIPLNLTHPELPTILKQVLAQVIEIFDYPPFLHLGGDELHISRPCLEEAGIENASSWLMTDVERFEEEILKPIVEDLGYGPHQILRWETKNQQQKTEAQPFRFGGITHYWESTPSQLNSKDGDAAPYMASTGLYLDVLGNNKRIYGFGEFEVAKQLVSGSRSSPPFAIVAGTFELGTEFWDDRNVLGRLLAIRMGVAASVTGIPGTLNDFKTQYAVNCQSIFRGSEFDSMCESSGWPRLDDRSYQTKWKRVWKEWKNGVCDGLTYPEQSTHIYPSILNTEVQRTANDYFWESVLSFGTNKRKLINNITKSKTNSSIQNVGIVVNLMQNSMTPREFFELLRMIEPLGINLIQLQLADDLGQVVEYDSIPGIGHHFLQSSNQTHERIVDDLYDRQSLEQMVAWAHQVGIQLVPEISLATNGGGWFKAGMLMDCPQVLCQKGRAIALDVIDKIESVMPVAMAVIAEVRDIFSLSSLNQFFHLGFDERELAVGGCFAEAGHNSSQAHDALHDFESKLCSALSLLGIDQKNILRWRNDEKIDYDDRTGLITHYIDPDDFIEDVVYGTKSARVFGTVRIADEMTPWEVYQETRRWSGSSPTPFGLVAKGSDGQIPDLNQLVAFVMALKNELDAISQDGFNAEFEIMCGRVKCTDATGRLDRVLVQQSVSEDLNKICTERTANVTTMRSRAFL